MKKISPLILFLLAIAAYGQTPQKVFFNKKGEKCDERDAYVYQITKTPEALMAPGYPSNDEDTVTSVYFAGSDKICKEFACAGGYIRGQYKFYYENGRLKEIGFEDKGRPKGKVTRYYPTGAVQEMIEYPEKEISPYRIYNFLILEYHDSSGVQTVNEGNGLCRRYFFDVDSSNVTREEGELRNGLRDQEWTGFYNDTLYYKDKFSNGKFIEGVRYYKGSQIRYTEVERQPEYRGGMEALSRFLAKELRYPADARRSGVDGKAFVQFIVLKDGSVTDVKVIKGVSPSIDEEAAHVVSIMPNWDPGMQRGKPVKARFVLPIRFKLDVGRQRR